MFNWVSDLYRAVEASLAMNTSHDELRGHIRTALHAAHGVNGMTPWNDAPYPVDVFPGHVVYSMGGNLHKRSYSVDAGGAGSTPTIKLGKPGQVHRAYVDTPVSETAAAEAIIAEAVKAPTAAASDVQQVQESVAFDETVEVKESKVTTIPVKIIGPGWGSMAYYSKEMIQKSGPTAYVKGTHMYWNHATESQESERPEGDLNNLAAVLTEDAKWLDSGPKGPGLYSKAKVFSDYASQVTEKGAHIGISINAGIKAHEGTAEGRSGRIADAFVRTPLMSADFVTKAGAKGAPIVPVTESQRGPQETSMDEKAQEALQKENTDLKARVASLEASQHEVVAYATVASVLREAEVPFKESLLRRACTNPAMKDGKVDEAWIKSIVADFSDGATGRVEGHGEVKEAAAATTDEARDKRLRKALEGLGVHKAGLDYAVAGRA